MDPFDDETGKFYALVNDEGQFSLWPIFAAVPEGWRVVYGEPEGVSRKSCLEFIEAEWTDIRPASLRDAMEQDSGATDLK